MTNSFHTTLGTKGAQAAVPFFFWGGGGLVVLGSLVLFLVNISRSLNCPLHNNSYTMTFSHEVVPYCRCLKQHHQKRVYTDQCTL